MKDDSRELPPARVWGAEEYNKASLKNTWIAKQWRWLMWLARTAFMWVFNVLVYVPRSVWFAYVALRSEGRGLVRAVSYAVAYVWVVLWFDFEVAKPLLVEHNGFTWWLIPMIITEIIGFFGGIVLTIAYEPFKGKSCRMCGQKLND